MSDRSIRNIPLPEGHRAPMPPGAQYQPPPPQEPMYEEDFTAPPKKPRKGFFKGRFFTVLVIVVFLCGAAGILMSTLFAGASVQVTPRSATVTAPQSITAQVNAPAGSLSYQVINSSRTASTSVPASGTQKVSRSASGVITIYNNTNEAQELITNTRFEAPDGKIYRIHTGVNIPAMSGTNPGSATAMVYASAPGAEYNKGQTRFTIPGFKGTTKYDKFYAETAGIQNGLVGDEPAVSKTDLANAEQALKSALSNALNEMLQTQVPKEFMALPGTLQISYSEISQSPGPNGTAILSQTASAVANVVRLDELAAAIARQTVDSYGGEPINFHDQSQISVALASSSKTTGPLTLNLSGTPTLVWQFDPNALKQALIGKPKKDFETILKSFAPAITCTDDTPCKASIRPFWSGSFPQEADKLEVTSETPKS